MENKSTHSVFINTLLSCCNDTSTQTGGRFPRRATMADRYSDTDTAHRARVSLPLLANARTKRQEEKSSSFRLKRFLCDDTGAVQSCCCNTVLLFSKSTDPVWLLEGGLEQRKLVKFSLEKYQRSAER